MKTVLSAEAIAGRVAELGQAIARDYAGRDLLLVEDIVDTGRTSTRLLDVLRARKPASLKLASLLFKPSRQVVPVPIDYPGFTIGDEFVVATVWTMPACTGICLISGPWSRIGTA